MLFGSFVSLCNQITTQLDYVHFYLVWADPKPIVWDLVSGNRPVETNDQPKCLALKNDDLYPSKIRMAPLLSVTAQPPAAMCMPLCCELPLCIALSVAFGAPAAP